MVFRPGTLREAREFDPDVIHHIPGPSIISLLSLRALRRLMPDSKLVVTFTHPAIELVPDALLRALAPDLAIGQSEKTIERLVKLGIRTKFIPNGVDLSKFKPVQPSVREKWRSAMHIEPKESVALHVGGVRKRRNVQVLQQLAASGMKVILIGRMSAPTNWQLSHRLSKKGVRIIHAYQPNLERYYAIADVYVFPVHRRIASIDVPLSVLEALACDTPVVTTPFGGLPLLFPPSDAVIYARTDAEIVTKASSIARSMRTTQPHLLVSHLSWDNIADRLAEEYSTL